MGHSISTDVKVQQYINPEALDAAARNGASVDTTGFNTAQFAIHIGAIGASHTFDAKVQESDDDSTWVDVAGAAIPQVGATDDDTLQLIELRSLHGRRKFLRVLHTVTGASTVLVAASVLLGRPAGTQAAPVQVPTVAV